LYDKQDEQGFLKAYYNHLKTTYVKPQKRETVSTPKLTMPNMSALCTQMRTIDYLTVQSNAPTAII